jgi:hypothetical protein
MSSLQSAANMTNSRRSWLSSVTAGQQLSLLSIF